ncbi:OLC1v1026714C1 [Oldenlandia corymbosa var. corymbosa]|uniref:OLC1v1026714C1 n=1 Tax=Oldenlandia corymbosa var. corymbosa TaxID=529605 RepID=A0AAV1C8G7_OLDCO|nr:OLC1v1026714C1 [Oldenlandia corymbosa var. corymbosa]
MVNPENHQSGNDRKIDEGEDRIEQSNGADYPEDSTSAAHSSSNVLRTSSIQNSSNSRGGSSDFEARREHENMLQEQSDRLDNLVLWLRALDVQVIGACRADERLKPLLKINAFTGAAEDRLLSHLSQHFDPSEVGMLARCLCVPLVSIRVGRINKLGSLLCPTATRGNLNLTLLPTSDLRISFIGDDGSTERLATLTSDAQCSAVVIEEILADKSGRSFLMKIPDNGDVYFWCSEKSKILGIELLRKMEDLLKRKPSIAELTGISEFRLESFGIHLRAYLVGSTMANAHSKSVFALTSHLETSIESSELGLNFQSSIGSKPSRLRQSGSGGQGAKPSPLYQGSLSPRPSSFKEAVARNMSSLRSASRERFRRRGDSYLSCIDSLMVPSPSGTNASGSNSPDDKFPEVNGTHLSSSSSLLQSLEKSNIGNPTSPSLFSPYYCWCPPMGSTLQYTPGNAAPLSTSSSHSLSLPTSLLSVSKSPSLLTSKMPLNLNDLPPLDFPPLLPDPLVMLPLSIPSSQQIPTFTPLMCDPIVHIPVIDVCSSGQGYLVSAGPAMSTALPPNLSNPLMSETDSVVEKSARETLRMLINSSNQPNGPLLGVLPSVLSNGNDMQNILAVGSRGLYSGTRDVDAIANSMSAMSLVSTSDGFILERRMGGDRLFEEMENPDCSSGSSCDDGIPKSE